MILPPAHILILYGRSGKNIPNLEFPSALSLFESTTSGHRHKNVLKTGEKFIPHVPIHRMCPDPARVHCTKYFLIIGEVAA